MGKPSANACAEGCQRESCELEILKPERDADDRDTASDTAHQKAAGELESAKKEPKDIDDGRARAAAVSDLLAEGKERKLCEFEALQADGNADDRDAPEKSDEKPAECRENAAENKP